MVLRAGFTEVRETSRSSAWLRLDSSAGGPASVARNEPSKVEHLRIGVGRRGGLFLEEQGEFLTGIGSGAVRPCQRSGRRPQKRSDKTPHPGQVAGRPSAAAVAAAVWKT